MPLAVLMQEEEAIADKERQQAEHRAIKALGIADQGEKRQADHDPKANGEALIKAASSRVLPRAMVLCHGLSFLGSGAAGGPSFTGHDPHARSQGGRPENLAAGGRLISPAGRWLRADRPTLRLPHGSSLIGSGGSSPRSLAASQSRHSAV